MAIEIGVDMMPKRCKGVSQIVTSLLILGFAAGILLIGGLDAVDRTMRQTNAAIPMLRTGQIYIALPLCGAFTVFYCLYNIWTDTVALIKGNRDTASSQEG